MSLFSVSHSAESYSQSTDPQQGSELRREIQDFLKSTAAQSKQQHLCPRCGAEMKHVDTTFSLLGTDSAWNIKVPLCECTGQDAARKSKGDH